MGEEARCKQNESNTRFTQATVVIAFILHFILSNCLALADNIVYNVVSVTFMGYSPLRMNGSFLVCSKLHVC